MDGSASDGVTPAQLFLVHPKQQAMSTATKTGSKKQQMTQEQIIAGFNQLRQEQRILGSRIVELESDANEHG